jgi:hypothetical protein
MNWATLSKISTDHGLRRGASAAARAGTASGRVVRLVLCMCSSSRSLVVVNSAVNHYCAMTLQHCQP